MLPNLCVLVLMFSFHNHNNKHIGKRVLKYKNMYSVQCKSVNKGTTKVSL